MNTINNITKIISFCLLLTFTFGCSSLRPTYNTNEVPMSIYGAKYEKSTEILTFSPEAQYAFKASKLVFYNSQIVDKVIFGLEIELANVKTQQVGDGFSLSGSVSSHIKFTLQQVGTDTIGGSVIDGSGTITGSVPGGPVTIKINTDKGKFTFQFNNITQK